MNGKAAELLRAARAHWASRAHRTTSARARASSSPSPSTVLGGTLGLVVVTVVRAAVGVTSRRKLAPTLAGRGLKSKIPRCTLQALLSFGASPGAARTPPGLAEVKRDASHPKWLRPQADQQGGTHCYSTALRKLTQYLQIHYFTPHLLSPTRSQDHEDAT